MRFSIRKSAGLFLIEGVPGLVLLEDADIVVSLMYGVDNFARLYIVAYLYALVSGFKDACVEVMIGLETGGENDAVAVYLLLLSILVYDNDAIVEYLGQLGAAADIRAGILNEVTDILVVGDEMVGGKQDIVKQLNHDNVLALQAQLGGQFASYLAAAYNYDLLPDFLLLEQDRDGSADIGLVRAGHGDNDGIGTGGNHNEIRIDFFHVF